VAKKSPSQSRPLRRTNTAARKPRSRPQRQTPSGRVHLYVGISLDGYIAAPDGGVDWLSPYGDAGAGFAPFITTIGSIVMGRVTYDHAVERGFASFGDTPTFVVTHRPLSATAKSVMSFTGDLAELVPRLRASYPGDIWLMGGGGVTKSFQEADLIDIWSVVFVPTVLGAGLPMFPSGKFQERRLRLVRTRKYPSGVVELRYERAAPGRSRRAKNRERHK
jgi:dihydrofolate reductase